MLATCGGDEPERVLLRGSTQRDQRVELVLQGGKVDSVRTRVQVHCADQRVWRSIRWEPQAGVFGVFEQRGSRFHVHQRADSRRTSDKTPTVTVVAMRGRVGDDGRSVSGTIEGRWSREPLACRATVRFSARRTP